MAASRACQTESGFLAAARTPSAPRQPGQALLDRGGIGIWVKRAGHDAWQTFIEAFGTVSPSKFSSIRLRPGDQVRLAMPGGGGYGDPQRRDTSLVERDIREGFVTVARARADYGFEE